MRIGIFGGGPAGLSAALWLKNSGFEPWIAELHERTGGMQNFNFLRNDWVLGQIGKKGIEIAADFSTHVIELGVKVDCGVSPLHVDGSVGCFRVCLTGGDGRVFYEDCAALLIATGTRYREAEVLCEVPGFSSVPLSRIIYGPYAFADIDACAGRRVLIVGGGDNAFENARLLLGVGAVVHMALRSPPCAQAVQREAVRQAQVDKTCHLYQPTRIVKMTMRSNEIRVRLANVVDEVIVDQIHVLAGYEPNTGFLKKIFGTESSSIRLDSENYLTVDSFGRTNIPGVYAAGDVCNPGFPSVVSAVALGARTAKSIEIDLYSK